MLSQRELLRYERQIMLPDWGQAGQEKLKKAEVVVIGAGGLGSAVLTYLAVAGVGRIRIVDGDKVELGNLNRQVLYCDKDVGREKADSAKERLESINGDIQVEALREVVAEDNVSDLIGDYPIVDALDNLGTRHLLNKVAVRRRLPIFHGAVHGFEGRATTIFPGRTACLKCLYQGVLPGKVPVVGIAPAVIGCIQATEVIKYLLGIGDLLANRLLVYDGLRLRFSELKLKRDPNCGECKSLPYPIAGGDG